MTSNNGEEKDGKKLEEQASNLDLKAAKSIRVLPKMHVPENDTGEKLSECSDKEWDASDEPFSAELLNVKNAPNRVTVFSGPYRAKETISEIKKEKPKAQPAPEPPFDDRPDRLAKIMENVFSELIDGRDLSKIKVAMSMKC